MPLTYCGVQISPTLTISTTDFGTLNPQIAQAQSQFAFQQGTLAGQADQVYYATLTANTSGTSLDVVAGGLLQPGPDGLTFSVVDVCGVYVFNKSSTATLTVGGGSNAVPNIGFKVPPLGRGAQDSFAKPAFAVTATSADIIKVVTDTGTASFVIVILGRSA